MTVQDIVGSYTIIGNNQSEAKSIYKGSLNLSLDENNRILAKWLINENQEQIGFGFFKNNVLDINFSYQGDDETIYKGVVVYNCISKDILDGFWSESYANPLYLGKEQCFRITDQQELVN